MAHPPEDPTREIAARTSLTPRRLVIALAGICLLVVAAVVWAVFGRAPETVNGSGIILPVGGYTELGTEIVGVIDQVLVAPGDVVSAGDPVVVVHTDTNPRKAVLTTTPGVVVDVIARPGRTTGTGQPLVIIDPAARRLRTTAFLPAAGAEIVSPGMTALVSPSDAPRSQYGFIQGRVVSVAPAPITRGRVLTLLGDNAELTDYFLAKGPVGEVTIEMTAADTPSGYQWTIGTGPENRVDSGTLADVMVVISDQSVVDRMVP